MAANQHRTATVRAGLPPVRPTAPGLAQVRRPPVEQHLDSLEAGIEQLQRMDQPAGLVAPEVRP